MANENITIRKKHSNISLSESIFETTAMSMPDISLQDSEAVSNLHIEIENLKLQLQSAHQEIDSLLSENNQLKYDLDKSTKVVELLKKVRMGEAKCSTPGSLKRKSRNQTSTPVRMRLEFNSMVTPQNHACNSQDVKEDTHSLQQEAKTSRNKQSPAIVEQKTQLEHSECNMDTRSESQHCYIGNTICSKTKCVLSSESPPVMTANNKHRVIILGDGQGRGLRNVLQNLLGSAYDVVSYLKPGAEMSKILEYSMNEISTFTKSDYVIILGGCCDKNPYNIDINLHRWLSSTANTNVIISEVPSNRFLNESKINYLLRFICKKYKNVLFMDMNYTRFPPSRRSYVLNLARSLLKEILCIHYHFKALQYDQMCQIKNKKSFISKYVQVNLDSNQNLIDRLNTDDSNEPSNEKSELECSKVENSNQNNLFRL